MQTIVISKQEFRDKMVACRLLNPSESTLRAIDAVLSECGKIKYVRGE